MKESVRVGVRALRAVLAALTLGGKARRDTLAMGGVEAEAILVTDKATIKKVNVLAAAIYLLTEASEQEFANEFPLAEKKLLEDLLWIVEAGAWMFQDADREDARHLHDQLVERAERFAGRQDALGKIFRERRGLAGKKPGRSMPDDDVIPFVNTRDPDGTDWGDPQVDAWFKNWAEEEKRYLIAAQVSDALDDLGGEPTNDDRRPKEVIAMTETTKPWWDDQEPNGKQLAALTNKKQRSAYIAKLQERRPTAEKAITEYGAMLLDRNEMPVERVEYLKGANKVVEQYLLLINIEVEFLQKIDEGIEHDARLPFIQNIGEHLQKLLELQVEAKKQETAWEQAKTRIIDDASHQVMEFDSRIRRLGEQIAQIEIGTGRALIEAEKDLLEAQREEVRAYITLHEAREFTRETVDGKPSELPKEPTYEEAKSAVQAAKTKIEQAKQAQQSAKEAHEVFMTEQNRQNQIAVIQTRLEENERERERINTLLAAKDLPAHKATRLTAALAVCDTVSEIGQAEIVLINTEDAAAKQTTEEEIRDLKAKLELKEREREEAEREETRVDDLLKMHGDRQARINAKSTELNATEDPAARYLHEVQLTAMRRDLDRIEALIADKNADTKAFETEAQRIVGDILRIQRLIAERDHKRLERITVEQRRPDNEIEKLVLPLQMELLTSEITQIEADVFQNTRKMAEESERQAEIKRQMAPLTTLLEKYRAAQGNFEATEREKLALPSENGNLKKQRQYLDTKKELYRLELDLLVAEAHESDTLEMRKKYVEQQEKVDRLGQGFAPTMPHQPIVETPVAAPRRTNIGMGASNELPPVTGQTRSTNPPPVMPDEKRRVIVEEDVPELGSDHLIEEPVPPVPKGMDFGYGMVDCSVCGTENMLKEGLCRRCKNPLQPPAGLPSLFSADGDEPTPLPKAVPPTADAPRVATPTAQKITTQKTNWHTTAEIFRNGGRWIRSRGYATWRVTTTVWRKLPKRRIAKWGGGGIAAAAVLLLILIGAWKLSFGPTLPPATKIAMQSVDEAQVPASVDPTEYIASPHKSGVYIQKLTDKTEGFTCNPEHFDYRKQYRSGQIFLEDPEHPGQTYCVRGIL